MLKATKNLYLPGTNKNVGFMLGNTMHIYDKHINYFPINPTNNWEGYGLDFGKKFIVEINSENFELSSCTGWHHDKEDKFYSFYDCTFKTPDNLDLIEMAHLYKNWRVLKN